MVWQKAQDSNSRIASNSQMLMYSSRDVSTLLFTINVHNQSFFNLRWPNKSMQVTKFFQEHTHGELFNRDTDEGCGCYCPRAFLVTTFEKTSRQHQPKFSNESLRKPVGNLPYPVVKHIKTFRKPCGYFSETLWVTDQLSRANPNFLVRGHNI